MVTLGVNIDHIATIRQARRTYEPDPVWGAAIAELAGADCITVHLREDRRHIQDRDVRILRQTVQTKLNLEMANEESIIAIALDIRPDQVTLVPEKREEITTEGGLDVAAHADAIAKSVQRFRKNGIVTSLFIDPDPAQMKASAECGAEFIEFHTGKYANAQTEKDTAEELEILTQAAKTAHRLGLRVNAGHGLNYKNVQAICKLPYIEELNIGHSIISRAVFSGLSEAVREMKDILRRESV
ncbi:MAG: pyridoxine 5'-phosphate synthase [Candidatus Auribacter fodinae]|jgi:pyridoxine 5-phosphate synthase|uniref:Pyridoxine 5'-phosphate synthase n=1 Tax=Candidatus Auribacter fodinae TaxID=2093366 RepID=A0A3A4QWV7_9BACT|nr:MAG: pyridoxine 5'-phosphate synthase [Candidatus Auribacter fodinae]